MTAIVAFPHAATIFAGVCACIFSIIGTLGNFITILALLKCPKMRGHATTAFVLSLCVSDLLFCSFSLPLTAIRFFKKAWTLGEILCKIFPVIFYGNVAVSLLSMVGITLNRYILIAYHHLYAQIYKPKFLMIQLILIWTIAFSMLLPPILGIWGELGLDEATFSCTILKKDGRSIKKYLFLIGFLIPCLVIIISYSCIYITVRRQKIKLRSHSCYNSSSKIDDNVLKPSSLSTKTVSAHRQREDNRLTIMMLTIFLCFILCFLPLMLVNVIDEHNSSYPWLHIFSSVMAWASSVINPFIYAASNRNYRVAYYKIFTVLKFWGEPLSPMSSRSYPASKNNSKDAGSGVMRSTPLFDNSKHENTQTNQFAKNLYNANVKNVTYSL